MTTECPSCGDSFSSGKGLKIHHQRSHNSPLGKENYFCDTCDSSFSQKVYLRKHYNKQPQHKSSGSVCPGCSNRYDELAKHYTTSEKCRPKFTDKQREIIVGLTMGDGSVIQRRDSVNPHIKVEMISPNYLEYVSNIFGKLSTSVKQYDYNEDSYFLQIRSHPNLKEYRNWYKSGEKIWPEDIELTPTTLKHYYCGDGTLNMSEKSANPRVILSMSNEYGNENKINNYFNNVGLPEPSNYVKRTRDFTTPQGDCITRDCMSAQFTVDQTKELFRYMGNPLPDFKYKWPNKSLK